MLGYITPHAGIADAVIHGETGFLVAERDVDGMAQHLIQLVRDPELCRRMGDSARKHILRDYSMERHIGCIQEVIDDARYINQHPGSR